MYHKSADRLDNMKSSRAKTDRRTNVDTTNSRRHGLAGVAERFFRTFRELSQIVLLLPLYALGCAWISLAILPGLAIFHTVFLATRTWPLLGRLWTLGFSAALGYLLYGVALVVLLPTLNFVLRLKLKAWRGPYYSLPAVPWFIHNGITYIMRFTFLEFITPSPLNLLFYRLMGMRIGRGTVINTSHISDPCLITMGEKVTIGGSATIVGHYGQSGYLVMAPVSIGDRTTIGLRASIMGGVSIGREAKILPHSVVMPKTVVPDGEIWGGVPARKMSMSELVVQSNEESA